MVTCLLFIALTNLGLGYYLGTLLTRPMPQRDLLLAFGTATLAASEPSTENLESQAGARQDEQNASDPAHDPHTPNAAAKNPPTWNTAGCEIRHDLGMLRDRIGYALTANDKRINKELMFELQSRTRAWQNVLQEKLAAAADSSASELCLAQIETLQTNLKLIDWSEPSESILKKLEREIEAVKSLLPADVK